MMANLRGDKDPRAGAAQCPPVSANIATLFWIIPEGPIDLSSHSKSQADMQSSIC